MQILTRHIVGKRAGVKIDTLRFYEEKGLLPKPNRTESNYRVYGEDTISRVQFIKRAQELGFSLKEIKELLSLKASPRSKCGTVRKKAETKIDEIESKVADLKRMQKSLRKLARECRSKGSVTDCPILESIDSSQRVIIDKEKT